MNFGEKSLDELDSSRRSLQIENVRGLHARASAKFVKCAEKFVAEITVSCNGYNVPGTSIMGLMMLGACRGTEIVVTACGPDHKIALSELSKLVTNKFGEDLPEGDMSI